MKDYYTGDATWPKGGLLLEYITVQSHKDAGLPMSTPVY